MNGTGHSAHNSSSEQTGMHSATSARQVTSLYTSSRLQQDNYADVKEIEVDNVSALLDYIAQIRLHAIPHPSSRLDLILQWAAFLATQAEAFAETSESFSLNNEENLEVVSNCCFRLLEVKLPAMYCEVWLMVYSWDQHIILCFKRYLLPSTQSDRHWLSSMLTVTTSSQSQRRRGRSPVFSPTSPD